MRRNSAVERYSCGCRTVNIYAYAFGYNNPGQILRALVWNNDTNFASFYSKNENTHLSKLSELLDKFQ